MKTIVCYYSRTTGNRFLAKKIAADLNCDIEEILPKLNVLTLMLLGINLGNKRLHANIADYDKVILCGPIWMGQLIVPLKNFIQSYSQQIQKLVFVSNCGSSFKEKDQKFGHNLVFKKVKSLLGDKLLHCEAFPLELVMTEADKQAKKDVDLDIHLNDENFKGEIVELYQAFIEKAKSL